GPARDHVRRQDRRGGPGGPGLPHAGAPVHQGARGGVPRDRRPPVPRPALGSRWGSARPPADPQRVSVPSSVRRGHGRVAGAGPGTLGRGNRPTRRVRARDRRAVVGGGPVVSDALAVPAAPAGLGTPVIEVEHLEVNFKGRVGLVAGMMGRKSIDAKAGDDVNLTLHEGEVLALAGESGCGKTTPAGPIMGLTTPGRATIRFKGKPLPRSASRLRPYRRQVQMVFQDPTAALNPRQTIYEIVAEGLRIHNVNEGPNGESEEE